MKKTFKIYFYILLSCIMIMLLGLPAYAEEEGDDSEYCTCEAESYDVKVVGTELHAYCTECDKDLPYVVRLNCEDGDCFCNLSDLKISADGWAEAGLPDYVVVFQDVDKEYEPTTEPEGGDYYVRILTLKNYLIGEFDSYDITKPILVTLGHNFTYTVGDTSIKAHCIRCNDSKAEASVYIDLEAIYDINKHPELQKEYNPVIEENWSNQFGIIPYYAFYDGYECLDSGKTRKYTDAIIKPTKAGSYYVRLAVAELIDGKYVELYSTKTKAFYIANKLIEKHVVHLFTETQKKEFPKPQEIDGVFQIEKAEELLWCVYNYINYTKMDISINEDIVFCPITISEEGKVYIGGNYMYNWYGFGTMSNPFNGTIEGNGHVIYGLYSFPNIDGTAGMSYMSSVSNSSTEGLIRIGQDVTIRNLTVENSYINSDFAGAFIGCALGKTLIENCYSINNYISGGESVGGFIGTARIASEDDDFIIRKCENDSILKAFKIRGNAGGIIGTIDERIRYNGTQEEKHHTTLISDCCNYGHIFSSAVSAGGIVGSLILNNGFERIFDNLVNIGKIEGTSAFLETTYPGITGKDTAVGGIIGRIEHTETLDRELGYPEITLKKCTSTGEIVAKSDFYGGIVGYTQDANFVFNYIKNYFYNCDKGSPQDGTLKVTQDMWLPYIISTEAFEKSDTYKTATTMFEVIQRFTKVYGILNQYLFVFKENSGYTVCTLSGWYLKITQFKTKDLLPYGIILISDYKKAISVKPISALNLEDIMNNFLCSFYGHKSARHYTDIISCGCETDGSCKLACTLCGKTMATKVTKAHGHNNEWLTTGFGCIYCGKLAEEQPGFTASVFGDWTVWSLAGVIVAFALAASVLIVIVKRRKKAAAV